MLLFLLLARFVTLAQLEPKIEVQKLGCSIEFTNKRQYFSSNVATKNFQLRATNLIGKLLHVCYIVHISTKAFGLLQNVLIEINKGPLTCKSL